MGDRFISVYLSMFRAVWATESNNRLNSNDEEIKEFSQIEGDLRVSTEENHKMRTWFWWLDMNELD